MFTPAIKQVTCPDMATLQQLLNDELAGAAVAPVQEHIDACPACQQALERLIGTLPGPLDAITPGCSTQLATEIAAPLTEPLSGPSIRVPGYEVLGEVGRGGMGVVYKARQLRPDRVVALKMLLAGRYAGPEERARFVHEAEAVAQLQHPCIVALYEAGQHGDLPYFTLEFVSGGSLADALRGTPLPPKDASRLVEQVARGMQYAHERGIVHRDLKPANILLQRDVTAENATRTLIAEEPGADAAASGARAALSGAACLPKITDFGLAKNIAVNTSLTPTGMVCGTPSYMAPEQAKGAANRVGGAADVYALGAILYECLTGRPPFQGPTPAETLLQVLQNEPVPPSVLQRGVPRDVETICLKCLHKVPNRRYASALELAEDLRRFQVGEPIRARPVGRGERLVKWCRRHPGVAALSAAVVLLVLIAGGLVTWQWQEAVTALDQLRSEKTARARRQAASLPDAASARVPAILYELETNRAEVAPLLRQMYEEEQEQPRRMRLALALLPVEPEKLREPLNSWMLHADDPAEVLLAREALLPYGADLAARLWSKAEDLQTPAAVRFRALVALAAFDPNSSRWQKLGPLVVQHLLRANPLHRGLWAEAVRPVGQSLLAPLAQASYFPLKVGTKWHYRLETSDGATGRIVLQVADIEKIGGRAVLARLEASERGIVIDTEDLSNTATGIFRHRRGAADISPPLCVLSFPVKTGESWKSDTKIGDVEGKATCYLIGTEEVEVPAGKYRAVIVHMEIQMVDELKITFHSWFAAGIGIVKNIAFNPLPLSNNYLIYASATTVGLMGTPLGEGPFHAASYLFPKIETTTRVLEKFEEGK